MLGILLVLVSCSEDFLVDISETNNLEAIIESEMKYFQMPGVAYASVKGDSIMYIGAKGYANCEEGVLLETDTRMKIASVSKTVVATALMQLYDQGLVALEHDINDYLPFEVRNPHFPHTPITVQMLLTHTSSIFDDLFHEFYLFGYMDYPEPIMGFMESYLTPEGQYFSRESYLNKEPGSYHQ